MTGNCSQDRDLGVRKLRQGEFNSSVNLSVSTGFLSQPKCPNPIPADATENKSQNSCRVVAEMKKASEHLPRNPKGQMNALFRLQP